MKVKVCRDMKGTGGCYTVCPQSSRPQPSWGRWSIGPDEIPVAVCARFFHRVCDFRLKPGDGPVLAEIPDKCIKLVKGGKHGKDRD